ncbi:transposase, partial [Rhizobium sp. Root1203]|uniref:transposase n=1 Tax=Rhizobium sp. Root1203 TaxID=1736427 RepID=UPI000AA5F956
RLRQIERQITAVDDAIMALIGKDASLKARLDILVSIPGVSEITAFTLLIEMPELGELDEKAAAALSGLAPMCRQSGRWTTAIMRKLIVLANALLRNNRKWTPKPA